MPGCWVFNPLASGDPANGWQQIAGEGIDIRSVPGGHNSMLIQPNVKMLADELKKVLPS